MIVLSAENLGVSFGEASLFRDVTFSVNQGDKLAIVGVNGAGKSTLMRLLYDDGFLPHEGRVSFARDKTIGYLEQLPALAEGSTVLDTALNVFSELRQMERDLDSLTASMNRNPDDSLIRRYSELQNRFSNMGGYEYQSRAKGALIGLGFSQDMLERKVSTLSGGQRTILQLSLLILQEPDILLLDEPTNHLDIKSLEWLEDKLTRIKSTLLVISHDRYFLDRVTQKTLELENGRSRFYAVPYSQYRQQKKTEREIQQRHYENQQQEIARMVAFILQQKRWNRERNIIAAQSRQKAIDRMEKVEKVSALPNSVSIRFQKVTESGNDVLIVKDLSKGFSGEMLFSDLSFTLKRKDRLLITGANGSGKSTLLQILTGNLSATSGSYRYGYNVRPGYYDQYQHLNDQKTVLEELWDECSLSQTELRSLLASFLFKGDDVFKKVSVLSGGERARLILAKLLQKKVNLLILDEPTNHLDIESREVLEDALASFEGTILAVSHDRYFIQKLATRILSFEGYSLPPERRVFCFNGDYRAFLDYRRDNPTKVDEAKPEIEQKSLPPDEKKHRDKEDRRKAARIRNLESEINRLEEEIRKIDRLCEENASDYQKLQELYTVRDEQNALCESLWKEWSELVEGE